MCVAVTSVFLASLQALPTTRIYVCMISVLAFFECGPGNEFKSSLKPNPLLGSPGRAHTRTPPWLLARLSCLETAARPRSRLPSQGPAGVTCVRDQRGHPLDLASLAVTEGESKIRTMC